MCELPECLPVKTVMMTMFCSELKMIAILFVGLSNEHVMGLIAILKTLTRLKILTQMQSSPLHQ